MRQTAAPSDDRVSQVVVDLAAPGLTDKLVSPGGGLEGRPVDLLICNAGVNYTGRLTATEDIQIVRTMEINLASVLVLTNIVINHNTGLGAPLPSVVLISSLSHYFSYPGGAIYGASKEGLVSLAKALRAMGATALAVFPGPMRTQMAWDAAPSNEEERVLARMDPDVAAASILKHVKQRDVAAVVATPGIVAFSRKAVHDPAWAEALMTNWQLKPLIAKQEHDRPGSSGF